MDTFSEVVDSEEVGVVLEESSNVGQRYHSCWDCNHIEDGARYNRAGKEREERKMFGRVAVSSLGCWLMSPRFLRLVYERASSSGVVMRALLQHEVTRMNEQTGQWLFYICFTGN